ncbi:MAG: septum formation initiator family protein [Cytophagales bacterium]|nr:septum formation initiator family protein [Cytophagales bacterium]
MSVMFDRLPAFCKNFYFVVSAVFLVWLTFLDSNDLINQMRLQNKLKSLKEEKEYYQKQIEEVKKSRKELLTSGEQLEKFAREKYFMKKKSEDLFIIINEK